MLLRQRETGMESGKRQTYNHTNYTEKKKEEENRNASIERSWWTMFPPCGARKQIGCLCGVSLKAERESLRKWGLEFAVVWWPPWGIKKAWKLSPVFNSDHSVCLSPWLTFSLCVLRLPTYCSNVNLNILNSMNANITVTGVIHTSWVSEYI